MKNNTKKLQLPRETIRQLSHLEQVRGGANTTGSMRCDSNWPDPLVCVGADK